MPEVLGKSLNVVALGVFAVAGASFAFEAGGHEALAEASKSAAVHQQEIHERNIALRPAVGFEAVAVGSVIPLIYRRRRVA